ncbi:MAG: nucleoside triphosphate pyrophosphohydrolase family protein [Candidatus Saccharibacteria bacterium]|nr:nucleoside triphosphate pyrophosphohydrolase family protein [Candidatus Saccharibacteria bacterium]
MTFDEYQAAAKKTNLTPAADEVLSIGFMDKVLGLVGESAEIAEKVKKILRDKQGELSEEDKQMFVKELGDVLWYIALMADNLGVPMDEVATRNVEKLASRQKRNKLTGSGDNR